MHPEKCNIFSNNRGSCWRPSRRCRRRLTDNNRTNAGPRWCALIIDRSNSEEVFFSCFQASLFVMVKLNTSYSICLIWSIEISFFCGVFDVISIRAIDNCPFQINRSFRSSLAHRNLIWDRWNWFDTTWEVWPIAWNLHSPIKVYSATSNSIFSASRNCTREGCSTGFNGNQARINQLGPVIDLEFDFICSCVWDVLYRRRQFILIDVNGWSRYVFGGINRYWIRLLWLGPLPVGCFGIINLIGFRHGRNRHHDEIGIWRSIVRRISFSRGCWATLKPNTIARVVMPLNLIMIQSIDWNRTARTTRPTIQIVDVDWALNIMGSALVFTKNGSIPINLDDIPFVVHNPRRDCNAIIVGGPRLNSDEVPRFYRTGRDHGSATERPTSIMCVASSLFTYL